MRYPITIEPGNDTTAWGVIVPDLPGCFSAGDTLEESVNFNELFLFGHEAQQVLSQRLLVQDAESFHHGVGGKAFVDALAQ